MKKSIVLLTIFATLHFTGMSQSLVKIGPSLLINITEGFNSFVEASKGLELSFETGIRKKMLFHIGTSYHYGKFQKRDPLLEPKIDQFWGLDAEFRYHFKERYHSSYLGLGFDIKFLSSQNYFDSPITSSTPEHYNDLVGFEPNFGISYGKFYEFAPKHFANPYIFMGIGGFEYIVHFRVGINYGFQTSKTNK